MSDVSITDYTKLAKHVRKIAGYEGITQGQSSVLRAAAKALEAVTVPTENERDRLRLIVAEAIGGGNIRHAAVTSIVEAVTSAGFRLPVPVEPEWEYGFSADGGAVVDRAFGIVPFETAESARHTGSKWFEETLDIMRRTKAIPAGKWQPVNTNETGEKP